jgi:hypothetical protein
MAVIAIATIKVPRRCLAILTRISSTGAANLIRRRAVA